MSTTSRLHHFLLISSSTFHDTYSGPLARDETPVDGASTTVLVIFVLTRSRVGVSVVVLEVVGS